MAELIDVTTMLAPAYQIKQQNRWVVEWEGIDTFLVKSFARPSGQFEEVVVDYINTKRYFQGKFSLNTIELVMYDPIDPSAAQKMWAWLNLCYEQISGRAGYKEMAVARGLRLKLLDPPGSVIEQYDFINALPMNFNFNTLDYGSGESLMCNVTLRYDAYIMQY